MRITKSLFCSMALLALTGAVYAQNAHFSDPNAQVRNVAAFHGIKVSSGIHLYMSQGPEEKVAVSANEQKYRDKIRTEVVNGVLEISYSFPEWTFHVEHDRELRAYVSFKNLDLLHVSSGANAEVNGSVRATNLDMNVSSGGSFKGDIQAESLKVKQSSGAQSTISGKSASLWVETSSGASFLGYNLETSHCDAAAHSGGSVEITVQKDLAANASSGGQIRYKGAGVISSVSAHSGGEVMKD